MRYNAYLDHIIEAIKNRSVRTICRWITITRQAGGEDNPSLQHLELPRPLPGASPWTCRLGPAGCSAGDPQASRWDAVSSRQEQQLRSPLLSALWCCVWGTDGRQLHNTTTKLQRWCSTTLSAADGLRCSFCLASEETKALTFPWQLHAGPAGPGRAGIAFQVLASWITILSSAQVEKIQWAFASC